MLPWRQEAFEAWLSEGAPFERGIPGYHLFQPPGKETIAPLMARDVSSTRSITQASVDWTSETSSLRHAPVDGTGPDWERFAHAYTLGLDNT